MLQWQADCDSKDLKLLEPRQCSLQPEHVGFRRPLPRNKEQEQKCFMAAREQLEQLVRDAIFARTTSKMSESRVLERAFKQFDKDQSGALDLSEFCKALEYLGLHVDGRGAPGLGGIPFDVVESVFRDLDTDSSGTVEYREFMAHLLQNVTYRHY